MIGVNARDLFVFVDREVGNEEGFYTIGSVNLAVKKRTQTIQTM